MYELAHTSIVVSDINKSKDFYTKVLGLTCFDTHETDRLKMLLLKTSNSLIELLEYKNIEFKKRNKGPIDHIAFYVNNLDEEIINIKKRADIKFAEPKSLKGKKLVFFEGLDGERIELIEK